MTTVGMICILAMIAVMLVDRDYENLIGLQMVVMLLTVFVLSIGVCLTYL